MTNKELAKRIARNLPGGSRILTEIEKVLTAAEKRGDIIVPGYKIGDVVWVNWRGTQRRVVKERHPIRYDIGLLDHGVTLSVTEDEFYPTRAAAKRKT